MSAEARPRPAFYALSPGSWRDYVTVLHAPYTAWHLSYVVIGAALAPQWYPGRLGAALAAFFLAVGVGAHALDELNGRPLSTRIPAPVLVAHLGIPRFQPSNAAGDSRASARRSIEELLRTAEPLGVRIAVEVIPNQLSRAGSIVHFVEHDLEGVGICLDFGHAHLDGDVVDAVETVSEHLIATHVHDNRGRADDHLLPFDGTIDWAGTLLAVQKVGYDGPFMFEIVPNGSTKETLARARATRQRIEAILADGAGLTAD